MRAAIVPRNAFGIVCFLTFLCSGAFVDAKGRYKFEKYLENEVFKEPHRRPNNVPIPVVELGLFLTSELEMTFYDKFRVNLRGGDIFQSTLLTNYLKGLRESYSHSSLGDVTIRISITRLEIVHEKVWREWKNLHSFCMYQSNYTDIDAAMLVIQAGGPVAKQMKVYALGQTYRGGVCTRSWRCGLVQENALLYSASRRLIAHEVAHSLGLTDQGPLLKRKLLRSKSALKLAADKLEPFDDLSCLEAKEGFMTGSGETWLPCSVRAMRKLLRSKFTKCLYTESGEAVKPDGTFIGLMKYIERDEMCALYLNSTSWIPGTEVIYKNTTEQPLCRFGVDECGGKYKFGGGRVRITNVDGQKWPTGTMCSEHVYDKLCYHGDCLSYDEILHETEKLNSYRNF